MRELVELWRFREVLFNLVRRNLKVRYKNSFLGFFWSLLNPLMQIGVWWLVFKVIMDMHQKDYTAELITGFLPWLFFSQCVMDSTACVTQEMALVKKAYFPRVILPLSALLHSPGRRLRLRPLRNARLLECFLLGRQVHRR
jgi:ABC-2 type transport system permease protein